MKKFYPLPFGHIEVRVDPRPPRSGRLGRGEGVWGNREVPQWQLEESGEKRS